MASCRIHSAFSLRQQVNLRLLMEKRLVAISFPYRDLLDNPTGSAGRAGATRIE